MTEHREHDEHPELLLAGADRPRPLSPALRARLEGSLAAVATLPDQADQADEARPLSDEVRAMLESSLSSPRQARAWRPTEKWRAVSASAGAAAVIVILAAVVVPGLVHGPQAGVRHDSQLSAGSPPSRTAKRDFRSPKALVPSPSPRGGAGPNASPTKPNAVPSKQSKALGGRHAPSGRPPTVFAPTMAALPSLVVKRVTPSHGPVLGGDWVTVNGEGMTGVNAVYFGSVAAVHFHDVSSSELKALAPAHSPGTVDIVVVTPRGRSAMSPADRYSFLP